MFTRMATSLLLILCGSVSATSPSVSVEKSCREHPQLAGKCFNVHGRLSTYNGNPAVRLWNLRTKRMLGVSDQRFAARVGLLNKVREQRGVQRNGLPVRPDCISG